MRRATFNWPSEARLKTTEPGCGGAPLGNLLAAIPDDVAQATLEAASGASMRWFDTSPLYGPGLSETRFGRCLCAKPRDGVILSTKVGRLLEDCGPDQAMPDKSVDEPNRCFVYDYGYDGVMRSFEASLD